jgi:hypothetical protein
LTINTTYANIKVLTINTNMLNSPLIQQFLVGLAVLTSMGTLVQDTKLGRAMELTAPLSTISTNISSHLDGLNEAASAHTHVEQVAVQQNFSGVPRVQVRDDHRRYNLSKYVSRNTASFGNTQSLWPSV